MNESKCDWGKFYDSEYYLLGEVAPAFRETGKLDLADFYTILIWKAERAKNYHKKQLMEIAKKSFQDAVADIAKELSEAPDGRHRLEILMNRWGFLLPTASAILTILYPEEFTVFDWRVCEELKYNYQPWCSRRFSGALWDQYEGFKKAVIEHTPQDLTLRCKDRFLIGRSTRKSIEKGCMA